MANTSNMLLWCYRVICWEFAIMPCPKCVVHCCNGFKSNLDQLQSTFSRVALIPWVKPSIFVFPYNFMENKLDLLCKCAQTISATNFFFISYYWLVAILLTHGLFSEYGVKMTAIFWPFSNIILVYTALWSSRKPCPHI